MVWSAQAVRSVGPIQVNWDVLWILEAAIGIEPMLLALVVDNQKRESATETVVVLNYSKEAAGSYKVVEDSGGVSAYREVCELVLIDRSIPAVIHRKTFRGPEPRSATSISHYQTEVLTPVDLTELRNYIMKLPSR